MDENIKITGEWLFYLDNYLVKREKNLLVQAGLNYLASLLIAENTNEMSIYLALGTGTTAAAAGDTTLENEGLRKIVSAKTRQGNMVRLRTYFLASEANNPSWTEFGIFLAGTDVRDSGVLLNRLVTPFSKSANTALTIEVRLTFAAG